MRADRDPVPPPIMGEWEFGPWWVLTALLAVARFRPLTERSARPRFLPPVRVGLPCALAAQIRADPGWPPGRAPGPRFPRSP